MRVAAGITGVGGFGGCHAGSGGGLGIFFSFGRHGPFMGSDGLDAFPLGWGGVEGLPGSAAGTCQARSLWQGYMLATPHGRAMLAMRK